MISSFFGLQTSLRGLLAQQRMLDTTGHNIANASTKGYSRQEATLVASPGLIVPAGSLISGAGAHIGSGVDVETFRRVRDEFVDLQYRSQNTNLGEWAARAKTLDAAELSLAEPGENGINEQLSRFWDAWADVANAPTDPAAKQALVAQGGALADAFATVRAQLVMSRDQGMAEYGVLSGPGGEVALAAEELAGLNDEIKRYITAGDIPNDLLDRRDLLIDQLSEFGQVSVTEQADGTVDVAFVDTVAAATTYPIVTGTTVSWTGPPAGDAWAPSGRLGGLLDASRTGGTLDGYLADIDAIAGSLATTVNGAYGAPFFQTGPGPAAATLRVEAGLAADPRLVDPGTGNAGSNDLALAVAALRDNATVDRAYQAFVAKVGAQVREARRQESNSQVVTDAVENRRQSVQGVSLDEEMANMVRFQRSYQASARAMSTMDEMLDVLINRTGRVGL